MMVAGSALAGVPGMRQADASLFSEGPKAQAGKSMAKAQTRADEALETFDFTYADYPYMSLSLNGVTFGVSRAYMLFEMTQDDIKTYAGSKVVGFSVYSPTDQNNRTNTITSGSFFYSTDPSLTSLDYTQDFRFSTTAYDLNKVNMTESYTITGEEPVLYFGYSLVVENGMYYVPIDFVETNPTAGIIGVSETGSGMPTQWMSIGTSYGALCMMVTLEGRNFQTSLEFDDIPATICLELGKKSAVPIGLRAVCGTPIDSFEIEYTMGGKLYSSVYSYSDPILPGVNRYMGAQLEFPAQSVPFNEAVEFRLTKLNNHTIDGSSAVAQVRAMENPPVHRTLMEEYTGTWCGYCPLGFAAMEYIRENYPEFVVASYHSGMDSVDDPMEVTQDFPVMVSGFPSASLNRNFTCSPYDGTGTYSNLPLPIIGDIEELNAAPTAWNVDVSHEWESADVLTAKAEVSNVVGYGDGNYKIAYLLIADSLTGNTARWYQTNYFYTDTPKYIEELNAFCRAGEYGKSKVRLTYNDVVVSDDGIHGVVGSIPTALEANETVEHTMRFDLTEIPSTMTVDPNKLRVIAAVIDPRGNVLNCAKDEVNDHVSTGVIRADIDENAPVEYFNLNGMKISQPTEGVFIRRQGSKAEKVMIR
ncbi:MAG: hypothetical protein K2J58_06620 [Muribaculaceae bacterium]|nr:hypothetical protein [Muribaculaceae bacterium]